MLKNIIFGAAAVFAVAAVPATAAVKIPVAVDYFPGTPPASADRSDPLNALTPAGDGLFLSLAFGGLAVFDFGETLPSSLVSISEATTTCFGSPLCVNHKESADILFSTSYAWGSGDIGGFTPLASVGNAESQPEFTAVTPSGFRYIAVLDTTLDNAPTASFDGYDIDSISATPIPVPAALPLIATAFGLVGWLSRRRRAA